MLVRRLVVRRARARAPAPGVRQAGRLLGLREHLRTDRGAGRRWGGGAAAAAGAGLDAALDVVVAGARPGRAGAGVEGPAGAAVVLLGAAVAGAAVHGALVLDAALQGNAVR